MLVEPTLKFLLGKYFFELPVESSWADVARKFYDQQILMPDDIPTFIFMLQKLQDYLISKDLEYRVLPIRKLVGNGKLWDGLLNLLIKSQNEVYVYLFQPGNLAHFNEATAASRIEDISDLNVIAPLNLEEINELYCFFQENLKIPVYPNVLNVLTSKWFSCLTFAPHAPRTFYFPEGTKATDCVDTIKEIAKREGIEYLILKDEYDFNLANILPYAIAPVDKIEHYLFMFYEHSKGISNLGGLLLQEFLVSKTNTIDVYRTHFYNGVIPDSHLHYHYSVNMNYKAGDYFSKIVDEQSIELVSPTQDDLVLLEKPILENYTYMLSSVDYIVNDGIPKIIDVNGVTATFSNPKVIETLGVHANGVFETFIKRVAEEENVLGLGRETVGHLKMEQLYKNLRKYGPGYISGSKILNIYSGSEISVEALLTELRAKAESTTCIVE